MSRTFKSDKELESYVTTRRMMPVVCLLALLGVSCLSFWLMWNTKLFTPIEEHLAYLMQVPTGSATVEGYLKAIEGRGISSAMEWRAGLSLLFGIIVAGFIAWPWRTHPSELEGFELIEGSEVFKDAKGGLHALKRKVRAWKKKGVEVYCGKGGRFRVPYDIETKHILEIGSVGSGKTASMLHAIKSILDRKDRAIIYDLKGNMTELYGGLEGVSILGLLDKRSEPWHIARDINDPTLARELAQTVIQETSDPSWSNNARDVLAGCIEYLIATKPDCWGFQDISDLLNGERKDLIDKLKSIKQGSVNTIDKPKDDKSAGGVFSTLRSGVWIFDILAKAWGNPSSGFSVREWLHDEHSENRVVIIRNYPQISNVSNLLIYLIFNQLCGEVVIPPFITEVKSRVHAANANF